MSNLIILPFTNSIGVNRQKTRCRNNRITFRKGHAICHTREISIIAYFDLVKTLLQWDIIKEYCQSYVWLLFFHFVVCQYQIFFLFGKFNGMTRLFSLKFIFFIHAFVLLSSVNCLINTKNYLPFCYAIWQNPTNTQIIHVNEGNDCKKNNASIFAITIFRSVNRIEWNLSL